MKAAVRTQYGPPAVLKIIDLPKPQPRDNEVLIRVHASTVNRTDMAVLTGKPYIMHLFTGLFKPKLPVTGTDFAGVVEAVGASVTKYRPGDRVFGFKDQGMGSHAEYTVVPENFAMGIIPEGVNYTEAAASLEAFHYAYNFLKKVPVSAGQNILVNGGTGGIGSAMIQILVDRGALVTATCRTEHLKVVEGLGARRAIDYTQTDFTQDAERFDAVMDAVGKSTFKHCKRLLKPGGIYVSSEPGPGLQNVYLPLVTAVGSGKKVVFPLPTDIPASIQHAQTMLEKHTFRPLIDRTYVLNDIREAFEYVATGKKVGNVVISI